MPDTFWINGEFVEHGAARVSAFDAGIQHAVGLFETMHAARGRVFALDQHLERLQESAAALSLADSISAAALGEAVNVVVARSGLAEGESRARVRLTMTGGDLNLLSGPRRAAEPTLMIAVTPATSYPAVFFEQGVSLVVASARANPFNEHEGHKTLNYWWRLRELKRAAAAQAGEALVLQVGNLVAGGTVSNLFAVRDGTLITPIARGEEDLLPAGERSRGGAAVHPPVLPGITRAFILDCADNAGVPARRKPMAVADVLDADEVFLTNSSWGVLPVVRIEGKAIGSGEPGELTLDLRERWLSATAG